MKTYILKITILLSICWLFIACNDFLNRTPNYQISSETALLSIDDAELSVNGFYNDMKLDTYYGGNMLAMGDNRGDDLRPKREGEGWYNVYRYYFDPNVYHYGSLWARCYNTIMRANTFLAGWEEIPAISTTDENKKNDFKGQALAVSALCHFDIIRLYCYPYQMPNAPAGLGPIIADRVILPYEDIPRSTLEEGYAHVINILTESLTLLSKDKNTGHFNYWSAKALLARVYLYKGDYDNAFKHADELINDASCPYSLATNSEYINYWKQEGGNETLLELLVTSESNINTNGAVDSWYDYLWHRTGDGASSYIVPTDSWINLMEVEGSNDIRYNFIQVDAGVKWIDKFPGTNGSNFRMNNPRLIRLSEVYLIAAEAALMKSSKDQTKADMYLDAIRRRANPSASQITATVDEILTERRKEFIGEGHRFFDLSRLGKQIDRTGTDHMVDALLGQYQLVDTWDPVSFPHIVLPIAATQRAANPACEQNPGYVD